MWGVALSALMGITKMGYGAWQKNKAKKEANANPQPNYNISSLYGDSLGLAEQQASQGFDANTLNAFTQFNQQNLASSQDATLQAGGGINDIAKLYGMSDNNQVKLLEADQTLKAKHIDNLFAQRAEMAGQQGTAWRINYYDRWKDRAVANAMLAQQGNNLFASGIDTLGNAAGQFAQIASVPRIPKSSDDSDSNDNGDAVNGGNDVGDGGASQWKINSYNTTPSLSLPIQNNPIEITPTALGSFGSSYF